MGITGSILQAHLEASQASSSPLRLIFHTLDMAEPRLVVVVGIDDFQAKRVGIAGTLVLTDVILFERIDIRVAIVDNGGNAMRHQAFNDSR
jgi:hypothetical protein